MIEAVLVGAAWGIQPGGLRSKRKRATALLLLTLYLWEHLDREGIVTVRKRRAACKVPKIQSHFHPGTAFFPLE